MIHRDVRILMGAGFGLDSTGTPGGGSGTVTSIVQGTGMSFSVSPITTTGTINLANTTVVPGSYTNADITIDAQGRITAAANGVAGSGPWTLDANSPPNLYSTGAAGAITTGTGNFLSGTNAGSTLTDGINNIVIGEGSLASAGTTNNNIALGFNSLAAYVGGSGDNIGIGFAALSSASGQGNTSIGSSSLVGLGTGNNNVAVGITSGMNLSSGDNNIYIANSGENTESGIIRIGTNGVHVSTFLSGTSIYGPCTPDLTTNPPTFVVTHATGNAGFNNIFIGIQAGFSNSIGTQNVAIGDSAFSTNTDGSQNTSVGHDALFSNLTGNYNVAIGKDALNDVVVGQYNTAVGAGALSQSLDNNNIAIGYLSGTSLANGSDNIYIANYGQATESGIIRIGTPGTHNETRLVGTIYGPSNADDPIANPPTFIVPYIQNNTGANNTFIGSGVGTGMTSGILNVAIGFQAMNGATGSTNVAIGNACLASSSDGSNIAIGDSAMQNSSTGSNNIAIGTSTLSNATDGYNVAVGDQALSSNTSGNQNVAIGRYAGFDLVTGSNNIYISNDGNTTESGQIYIGTDGTHTDTYIAGILHGNSPTVATVNLTAQTAVIAATTLVSTAGLYRVSYVLQTTTADNVTPAGSIQLTLAWTDAAGATTTTSAARNQATLGRTQGSVVAQLESGNFDYSVALTAGTLGTSVFALRITAERLF